MTDRFVQYKFTLGTNIFCCIICATCATIFDAPARYMWFGFGVCLFSGTCQPPSSRFTQAAAKWPRLLHLIADLRKFLLQP